MAQPNTKVVVAGVHGGMAYYWTAAGFTSQASYVDASALKDEVRYLHKTCKNAVRSGYVTDRTRPAPTVVVVYSVKESTRRGRTIEDLTPHGFLLAFDDEEGQYIDIICADHGLGRTLLLSFIQYVQDKDLGSVTLSSLPTVLTYYPKFGFEFRKSCRDPAIKVPERLQQDINELVAAKALPRTRDEAYDNPVYAKLLQFLQTRDLNVKKEGCTKYNARSFKSNDCGLDGYTMKKCMKPKKIYAAAATRGRRGLGGGLSGGGLSAGSRSRSRSSRSGRWNRHRRSRSGRTVRFARTVTECTG